MSNAHSPSGVHKAREQRAQEAAVMRGYARALDAAYPAQPLPAHVQRLLDQLDKSEPARAARTDAR